MMKNHKQKARKETSTAKHSHTTDVSLIRAEVFKFTKQIDKKKLERDAARKVEREARIKLRKIKAYLADVEKKSEIAETLLKQAEVERESHISCIRSRRVKLKYSSERDIQAAIKAMERRIVEENLPLREENQLVRDISHARSLRSEVAALHSAERNNSITQRVNKIKKERTAIQKRIHAARANVSREESHIKLLHDKERCLDVVVNNLITLRKDKSDCWRKMQSDIEAERQVIELANKAQQRVVRDKQKEENEARRQEKLVQDVERDEARRRRRQARDNQEIYVDEKAMCVKLLAYLTSFIPFPSSIVCKDDIDVHHDSSSKMEEFEGRNLIDVHSAQTANTEHNELLLTFPKKTKSKRRRRASKSWARLHHNPDIFELFERLDLVTPLQTCQVEHSIEAVRQKLEFFKKALNPAQKREQAAAQRKAKQDANKNSKAKPCIQLPLVKEGPDLNDETNGSGVQTIEMQCLMSSDSAKKDGGVESEFLILDDVANDLKEASERRRRVQVAIRLEDGEALRRVREKKCAEDDAYEESIQTREMARYYVAEAIEREREAQMQEIWLAEVEQRADRPRRVKYVIEAAEKERARRQKEDAVYEGKRTTVVALVGCVREKERKAQSSLLLSASAMHHDESAIQKPHRALDKCSIHDRPPGNENSMIRDAGEN